MWDRLRAGMMTNVSTDHAPWPADRKGSPDIFANGAGLTGLQSFAPLFYTLLDERGLLADPDGAGSARRGRRSCTAVSEEGRDPARLRIATCWCWSVPTYSFDEASIQDRPEMRWSPYHGRRDARARGRDRAARAHDLGWRDRACQARRRPVRAREALPDMARSVIASLPRRWDRHSVPTPRAATLARLVALLERAAAEGARLVVFPELALTTFFPRWLLDRREELDGYFERAMPNPSVQPLFDRAPRARLGFYVGYAELTDGRPPLQQRDARRPGRRGHRHVPQGASSGQRRAARGGAVPAAGEALFRIRRSRLPDVPRAGRSRGGRAGHDDLQRSALAGGVARARAEAASSWSASATIPPPTTRMAARRRMRRCEPSTRGWWRNPMPT